MDKLLNAIERYERAETAINSLVGPVDGSPEEVEFQASISEIMTGGHQATTVDGAMKALRLAKKEAADFDGGSMVGPLLNGAMAYFDGLDHASGGTFASAVDMVENLDLSDVRDTAWMAIHDGLTLAAQGIEGIMQRPQCQDRGDLNAAGQYLQAISDFLFSERRRAMELLVARPFNPAKDPQAENMVMLQWFAHDTNGEELDEMERAVTTAKERCNAHIAYRAGKEVRP